MSEFSSPRPLKSIAPGHVTRAERHIRLTRMALESEPEQTPPFLILYVNSICNLKCEHCLYWASLNRRDDLTFEEFTRLSAELGPIENLNLSGGEPFLRKEFAAICRMFIRQNGVKQIYVPTNGWYTAKTIAALEEILDNEKDLWFFVCEISLDGTPDYHDRFRGAKGSFAKAMETYDALTELQKKDPRLRIHSISTATNENIDEIGRLTELLHERCPAMDHHNLGMIRGDRKNPSLQGPVLGQYQGLFEHIRHVWRDREKGRFGAVVEPMLHWVKLETAARQEQVVPCRAGRLSGVVFANGDVSLCETHPPIGNLRKQTFREIWFSPEARQLRGSIARRDCYCTNEIFMWPSIVFHPTSLVKSMVRSRIGASAPKGIPLTVKR